MIAVVVAAIVGMMMTAICMGMARLKQTERRTVFTRDNMPNVIATVRRITEGMIDHRDSVDPAWAQHDALLLVRVAEQADVETVSPAGYVSTAASRYVRVMHNS